MSTINRIKSSDNLEAILSELQKEKWETLEYSASEQNLREFVTNPHNYLLLAYEASEVAGMLTAHQLHKIDERKVEIMLYEIEVKAKFRQRGIGKLLIEDLLKLAKARGAYEVWVLTENENLPANRLYESISGKHNRLSQVMYKYDLVNQ